MDPVVFAAVLVAAACHAGWNAVIKFGLDPFSTMALIAVASMAVAVPLVPIVGFPSAASWPWLAGSLALHLAYFIGLTEAYRTGDMGQVYPIARGTAPLLTALASYLLLGEDLGILGSSGIVVLVCGVVLVSVRGGRNLVRLDRRAVGYALFTAVSICGYSLVDGIGARKAYWIVIWAMTVAPIALVAALRETSVLFGAAFAVVFLGEPLRPIRILAAVLIVAALALIRLH